MAFWQRYPYTDDHQLNLDWVIAEIQKIRAASGITYDDADTELGADNVQAAIEKLNELIAQVAQMSSAFNLIDNTIAVARWIGGHSYTHLQTVNDPTLVAIIDAVKNSKLIVLKIAGTDTNEYFYEESVKEIPGDYQHILALYNPFTNTKLQLVINGLNDSQNVFCEILPEEVSTIVNSFNNRTGDVIPTAGDYEADDITLNAPGITATNVQDGLIEINGNIPANVVESFKGRSGVVLPASGDYEAREVSYDNSVSHITASDVQTAIDTIVTLVLSSGVASFNGRVGAVIPTAGDYDATQIDYDNTTSGLAATTVQEAIDELAGGGTVSVTLTINGAKEDSITIYDSNNVQVGSCIFASGQTSGTAQIDVPVGGGNFKFVSSVAKATDGGGTDYEKTIALTDDAAQTVYVMPTDAGGNLDKEYCPWYGNRQIYLPNTFTAHEYIGTSGTQYFDTGVTPTSPLIGELEADILQTTTGYLLGAYDDGNRAYILGTGNAANRIVIGYNALTVSGGAAVAITIGQTYNWKTVLKNGEQAYYQDGVIAYSNNVSGELNVNQTLYLNANHENNQASQISTARYRSVKITVGGTMVRNFVPCTRIADSVVGMYDIINDVFYTNQGTGTFTFG